MLGDGRCRRGHCVAEDVLSVDILDVMERGAMLAASVALLQLVEFDFWWEQVSFLSSRPSQCLRSWLCVRYTGLKFLKNAHCVYWFSNVILLFVKSRRLSDSNFTSECRNVEAGGFIGMVLSKKCLQYKLDNDLVYYFAMNGPVVILWSMK